MAAQPWQGEIDTLLDALEKALNEINTPGPFNTALAVRAARIAVEAYREKEQK